MTLIYLFDLILSADELDTISLDHRGLYKRYDLAKPNKLFDPKTPYIP